jgi:riboflavin transporter FmnP
VGGFAMGPLAALLILLIKDLTGLLHSNSMGVGEIAIS